MSQKCKFDKAWVGKCNKKALEDDSFCIEHSQLTCDSCGEQATHTCSETSQFVCGALLCDDCNHTMEKMNL